MRALIPVCSRWVRSCPAHQSDFILWRLFRVNGVDGLFLKHRSITGPLIWDRGENTVRHKQQSTEHVIITHCKGLTKHYSQHWQASTFSINTEDATQRSMSETVELSRFSKLNVVATTKRSDIKAPPENTKRICLPKTTQGSQGFDGKRVGGGPALHRHETRASAGEMCCYPFNLLLPHIWPLFTRE